MVPGRKSSVRLVLSDEERQILDRWQRSTSMAAGLVRRGRIILLLADGHSHTQVARLVLVQRAVVRTWARRFLAQRTETAAKIHRLSRAIRPGDCCRHHHDLSRL
jgi:hypothetical protein